TGLRPSTGSKGSFAKVAALIGSAVVASSMVWPSGAARDTYSVPMLAAAPGLFSTVTGCCQILVSCAATSRAVISVDPPGGNGTTMRTAREGKSGAADCVACVGDCAGDHDAWPAR